MLTTDNYECTWALFKSIPSLARPGRSVFDETLEFNKQHVSNAMARLIDRRRAKVPVASMGFSMHDRIELLKLANTDEATLGTSCITDHLSPDFFQTEFWFMWVTTFAFQPWHSAVEFWRYLHRFMLEFSRIETLAGVKRTVLNQYDSLVVPLQRWLQARGVQLVNDCTVIDIETRDASGCFEVISLTCVGKDVGKDQVKTVLPVQGDLVFVQNGSMTDASSLGSMTAAPAKSKKAHNGSWSLWEKLAEGRPLFANPAAFNSCVAQSDWASFTVTLRDPAFFDQMHRFSGNEAGTGGLVTFKDSNWLMSIVLAHQPHFANQPAEVQVFWGYGLFPDRIGDFVAKAMADCTGAEVLQELCGHLRFDLETVATATCIPCRMPYITSMFMPRAPGDRPLPVPRFTSKRNDAASQTDATRRFKADGAAQGALAATVQLSTLKPTDFDAVFYPGGHDPLWDLAEGAASIALEANPQAALAWRRVRWSSKPAARHLPDPGFPARRRDIASADATGSLRIRLRPDLRQGLQPVHRPVRPEAEARRCPGP